MGILGTSLMDGTNLPIPLYLPNQAHVRQVQKESARNFAQVRATKFGPVSLPTVSGLATTVPASLFYVPENAGRYGMIPGSDASSGVTAVFFDLIKNERHNLKANVSNHPVENGSPLSDHIQNDPREGSFTAMVTNHSLLRSTSDVFGQGYVSGARPVNAAMEAFSMLKQLWLDKKLVELVLVMDTYSDIAISSISAPKSAEDGDSITFEISFVQVRKVRLKEISIRATVHPPSMAKKRAKQASTKMINGTTAGVSVGDNIESDIIEEET